jgi:chaperonin GroES
MKILAGLTGNRILIEQKSAETKQGGIIIPETVGKKPLIGSVIAVSEKGYVCPKNGIVMPFVKVGDTVMYENHTGSPCEIDGKDYVLVLETNCFCIL